MTLKCITFLKSHKGYMLASSEIPQILSPLGLPLNVSELRNILQEVSLLPRERLSGFLRPLERRKRETGRQRPPEPSIFITGPSLSSSGYLLPGTLPILPSWWSLLRLTSEWKTLDEACLLPWKVGVVQWAYHFHDHSDQNDAPLYVQPWTCPIWPWVQRNYLYKVLPLIIGLCYYILLGLLKPSKRHWNS